MKKISILLLGLCTVPLWGAPSQMTFQGTLKQRGVPVNATKNMQFSFVDGLGASIPGTTPILVANVQVTNGLFAVQLPIDPAIPWGQYSPYIQVSVEGQILAPNQPLNANLYAVAAIPPGLIALFATNCPVGWTEFTALQGRFPVGVDPGNASQFSVGQVGGSLTHNHGGTTGTPNPIRYDGKVGGPDAEPSWNHSHGISSDSSLPPYKTMRFCQKS